MFLLCSKPPGTAKLPATPPFFDAEEEERAAREIAHYRELAELGMALARAAAARALTELEQSPEPSEANSATPPTPRAPNHANTFLRLSYAVRAAHTAERRAVQQRAEARAQAAAPKSPPFKPAPAKPQPNPAPAASDESHLTRLFDSITAELGLAAAKPAQAAQPQAAQPRPAYNGPAQTINARHPRPYIPP